MRQCIIKVMLVFGQYFLQLLKMLAVQYPVSMRQCIIKVMVVFGQYFLQLLKMLAATWCS